MQGHGSTCDCTFSVLLHIALCLLCCVICCFGGIKPPRDGFIAPKGVISTSGVALFPIWGWFYAWDYPREWGHSHTSVSP